MKFFFLVYVCVCVCLVDWYREVHREGRPGLLVYVSGSCEQLLDHSHYADEPRAKLEKKRKKIETGKKMKCQRSGCGERRGLRRGNGRPKRWKLVWDFDVDY